jgi:CheY-like chemotaxis protein
LIKQEVARKSNKILPSRRLFYSLTGMSTDGKPPGLPMLAVIVLLAWGYCGLEARPGPGVAEWMWGVVPVMLVVLGLIRQSGEQSEAASQPDSGISFNIYLPAGGAADSAPLSKNTREILPGNETILLVEDQDDVRTLARHLLEARGYKVLEAANGRAALDFLGDSHEPIHLLLSDVMMPGMGGRELAEKVVALRPEIKVLFVSGYTNDAVMRHGISASQTNFLQKPFSGEVLHLKVRKVLGG